MKKIILIIIAIALIIGGVLIGLNIGKSNTTNTTNSVNNSSVAQNQSNTQNNTNTVVANNTQATENKTETNNNTKNTENKAENKNNTQSTENKTTNDTQKNETKVDNTQNEQNEMKGVWQYPDSTYPDEELIIKSIENNKITFDYIIDGITSFDNVVANLDKNIATFDVKNDGDWNIKGTMTFKDNKLILDIKESSNEYIPVKTTTFSIKTNKSVLQ